jgi:GT2 family glycosyltransferase
MFEKCKIVAVLTAYKRDYFSEQISSLLGQTISLDKIIILNNGNLDLSHLKQTFGDKINLINSELNTKFWGRFAIANLLNTEYILMLDDDTIPGSKWVENCLRLSLEKNCIVTGNGRSIDNTICWGDGGHVNEDTKIGFGGHSWFYKKDWLQYFITEKPLNYNTGEDITFSALCKIKGNIDTWIPKQSGETSAHKGSYSGDIHASFRQNDWDLVRNEMCQYFIKMGWSI